MLFTYLYKMRETLGHFVIVLGFFIILYWYALWGILDEVTATLHTEYGVSKLSIYGVTLAGVILFMMVYPPFFQHIC